MSNTNVEDSKRKTCAKIHSFSYFKQKLCLPNLINSNQLNNVYPTEKFELSTAYYELYLEKEGEKKIHRHFPRCIFRLLSHQVAPNSVLFPKMYSIFKSETPIRARERALSSK